MKLYPGTTVRIVNIITATNTGIKTDPDTLTVKVRDADGDDTTYTYGTDSEMVRSAQGEYYADITIPDEAESEGTWYYRWTATGDATGVTEGNFKIWDSPFAE